MEDGVTVSLKEIYDMLQEIKSDVNTVQAEIKNLGEMDARSREALEIAKDALAKARDLEKQIERIESRQQWIQGLFLTAILGIGGFLLTYLK